MSDRVSGGFPAHRFAVAPMMDWTDRHCRVFHRALSRNALLYTEMVTDRAVIHGDRQKLLGFSDVEHPVALQLGGSDPALLAEAVRIGAGFGYDEINLNVGCPSDRVQSGAFGACLMRDPELVGRCVDAMIDVSGGADGPEITVKCRIGVDDQEPAVALREFVRIVAGAGVRRFTIHARKAWLDGLSPRENRTIPPLDYPLVAELRDENPDLAILLNGGIDTLDAAAAHLSDGFEGVMLGRAAYHDPYRTLSNVESRVFGIERETLTRPEIVEAMIAYLEETGTPVRALARHMLGLFAGQPGTKAWKRYLAENLHLDGAGPHTLRGALAQTERHMADA